MIQMYTTNASTETAKINDCYFVRPNHEVLKHKNVCYRISFPDDTIFHTTGMHNTYAVRSNKNISDYPYDIMVKIDGVWTKQNDLKSYKYNPYTISRILHQTKNLIRSRQKTSDIQPNPNYIIDTTNQQIKDGNTPSSFFFKTCPFRTQNWNFYMVKNGFLKNTNTPFETKFGHPKYTWFYYGHITYPF